MSFIRGLGASKASLRLQGKNLEAFVKTQVEIVGRKGELEAKSRAAKDLGDVAQKMSYESTRNGFGARLSSNSDHGVVSEFGSGGKVDIPKGYESMAKKAGQAMKKGKWKDFIENIEDWAVRKGMDKSAAYPIAMSIYKNGVKATPALIPSAKNAYQDLVRRLRKRFKK
jgi:hypothetical protein